LCAGLLQVSGFSDIDPQCPLGGRDGRKDILCTRDGQGWLAAAYFPSKHSDFKAVKKKFHEDFEGVARHSRHGFVFLVNQHVTPGERTELERCASPTPVDIYHLERMRSILDSPKGYGLRLEYLRIPMTEEEQHSLWSAMKDNLIGLMEQQASDIRSMDRKMDIVLERTLSKGLKPLLFETSSLEAAPSTGTCQFSTADLQVRDIFLMHQVLCDGSQIPRSNRGRFRDLAVWVGKVGSTPDTARFVPPPPDQIESLLEALTAKWRSQYELDFGGDQEEAIEALAGFHHGFVSIHPFLDGNGRVARAILQEQAFELTGRCVQTTFADNPAAYFESLSAADAGDLTDLTSLIRTNLE